MVGRDRREVRDIKHRRVYASGVASRTRGFLSSSSSRADSEVDLESFDRMVCRLMRH